MADETLSKIYEPKAVEEKWLTLWLQKGYGAKSDPKLKDKSFSIVIPPPNVTGVLHMGHALNNTLQDILCRYQRMKGKNVLWVVGTDHAGIATQNVVERKLAAEGKSRHELRREQFIAEVWQWKEKHGDHIIHQLQRLGASCDWDNERFTMDAGLSKAVGKVFVDLYEKGLIHRDQYLINWCPRCHTALSDLEVEHEEQKGQLWHIRYPITSLVPHRSSLVKSRAPSPEPRAAQYITVATTRPETMLGDTAVAVHPDDERYQDLIGKTVLLPLVEREIPIIADTKVDREFGSGAVKITPAHDFNDFLLGNEHKLERINIFTESGQMNENAIHFKGQDRFECRKNIVTELEEKGFLVKVEDHQNAIGHCYRCKTIVEPTLSLQWFVRTKPLAKKALQAVREGKTQFFPEHWTKTYEQWLENIQDWCISRQIWWGHQIPAWYCRNHVARSSSLVSREKPSPEPRAPSPESCEPIVAMEAPDKCPTCGSTELTQDPDVLDTWFSSALWPFSTLGWPDKTDRLKTFYPTSVLVTAFDIIFFWVARMMMLGLEFMGEVPFRHVYIHALVRDAEGKKMSKSKGNVIDPLEIMDKFGTDAFRFTLAALAVQGRDIKLSEEVIQGYRNFCNKIWNASRFALINLEGYQPNQSNDSAIHTESSYDFWIRSKLCDTIDAVEKALESYQFDKAAKALYQFFWHDFCDWYLEYSKGQLGKKNLYEVLTASLSLLHPFMPFITEEIWHRLSGANERERLEQAMSFPTTKAILSGWEKWTPDEAALVDLVTQVIEQIRSIRGENRISPAAQITSIIYTAGKEESAHLNRYGEDIKRLTRSRELRWVEKIPGEKGLARGVISDDLQVFIPLQGLVDFEVERARLEKEIKKLIGDEERIAKKLSDKSFIERAPQEVVAEQKEKQRAITSKRSRLEEAYESLSV